MSEILSASKIKTLESCSWIYYCKYVLKMPDSTNSGSTMGTACHLVFECLGKPRRKKLFAKIKRDRTIKKSKSILRLCQKSLKRNGLSLEDKVASPNFKNKRSQNDIDIANLGGWERNVNDESRNLISVLDLIDMMILKGINHDFHCKGSTEGLSEQYFLIEKNEEDKKYKIRGFIDKIFLFKKKKEVIIRDFKSSKKKFEGKELHDNVQDLTYRLASQHLFPEYENRKMEFVFLQHEDHLVTTRNVSNKELAGFEYYLTEVQNVIDNFDEKMALSGLAADKGFLPSSEGFAGRLMCSRAEAPNQKKVNGEPYWICPYKLARYYYVLYGENNEIIKTSLDGEDLKVKEGERIEKEFYSGCPAFKHLPYNKDFLEKYKSNKDSKDG